MLQPITPAQSQEHLGNEIQPQYHSRSPENSSTLAGSMWPVSDVKGPGKECGTPLYWVCDFWGGNGSSQLWRTQRTMLFFGAVLFTCGLRAPGPRMCYAPASTRKRLMSSGLSFPLFKHLQLTSADIAHTYEESHKIQL